MCQRFIVHSFLCSLFLVVASQAVGRSPIPHHPGAGSSSAAIARQCAPCTVSVSCRRWSRVVWPSIRREARQLPIVFNAVAASLTGRHGKIARFDLSRILIRICLPKRVLISAFTWLLQTLPLCIPPCTANVVRSFTKKMWSAALCRLVLCFFS